MDLVGRQRRSAVEWETTVEALERLADGIRDRDAATLERAVRQLDAMAGSRVATTLAPDATPAPPPVLELRNRLVLEIDTLRRALDRGADPPSGRPA